MRARQKFEKYNNIDIVKMDTKNNLEIVQKASLLQAVNKLNELAGLTIEASMQFASKQPLLKPEDGAKSLIESFSVIPWIHLTDEHKKMIAETISLQGGLTTTVHADMMHVKNKYSVELKVDLDKLDEEKFALVMVRHVNNQNLGIAFKFDSKGDLTGGSLWAFERQNGGGLMKLHTDVKFDSAGQVKKIDRDTDGVFKNGQHINLKGILGLAINTDRMGSRIDSKEIVKKFVQKN